jgi:hypothetical protein
MKGGIYKIQIKCNFLPDTTLAVSKSSAIATEGTRVRSADLWRHPSKQNRSVSTN